MLFTHGTNHSKGVVIRFSENLQIDIRNVLGDNEGRYILVEALVQDRLTFPSRKFICTGEKPGAMCFR